MITSNSEEGAFFSSILQSIEDEEVTINQDELSWPNSVQQQLQVLADRQERISTATDTELVDRAWVLRQLGIREIETATFGTLRRRIRATRAPPPTPIEGIITARPSFQGQVTAGETADGFLVESICLKNSEVPNFLKNCNYPLSDIFSTCFRKEIQDAEGRYLDENGMVKDDHEDSLKKVSQRLMVLQSSIDYLDSVVPPGR